MSTEYHIRVAPVLQYFGFDNSMLPKDLWEQAERCSHGGRIRDYFTIGTSFANGKTAWVLANFELRPSESLTREDFEVIASSGKPYYSKWDKESSLFLHDHPIRFVWHTAGKDFWEKLPASIEVNTQNVSVNTLGDLIGALYGPNISMDIIEDMRQGNYKEDVTSFPSYWLQLGQQQHNNDKPILSKANELVHPRIFDVDLLRFVLKNYGYETSVTRPGITILAKEKPLPGEDQRYFIFSIQEDNKQTLIKGEILPSAHPFFDPSEESDEEFLSRSLSDIIQEYNFQAGLEMEAKAK
jgi:hypothetical protein